MGTGRLHLDCHSGFLRRARSGDARWTGGGLRAVYVPVFRLRGFARVGRMSEPQAKAVSAAAYSRTPIRHLNDPVIEDMLLNVVGGEQAMFRVDGFLVDALHMPVALGGRQAGVGAPLGATGFAFEGAVCPIELQAFKYA